MSWQKIVSSVAPTLGAALGGPFGGMATKFIADKLMGKADASSEEVSEFMLGTSGADMARLKELDNEFKLETKRLGIDVFALEVKDRESARMLFKLNIWPQIVLSTVFVVGYFGVLYFLMVSGGESSMIVNPIMTGVFTTILGVLTAAIPQILNFWFGSSLGSKEKTNAMKG